MKRLFILFIIISPVCSKLLWAQHFALANDKNNIAYIGMDNPISIAVENCPCNNIVLKVDNGKLSGSGCQYIFRGKGVGAAYIKVYKRSAGKLKMIGRYAFRVKQIPPPAFKIGPYSLHHFYEGRKAKSALLGLQEYVRAELEGFDYQAVFVVDSFRVNLFHANAAKIDNYFNIGNKLSQPIKDAFSGLKAGDVVFFYKIFARGPDGIQWELDPLILTIED